MTKTRRARRKAPPLRKPVPAALRREPPVIADTATCAPLTYQGVPIVFDNDPPPLRYPGLPPGSVLIDDEEARVLLETPFFAGDTIEGGNVPHGTSEAVERLEIGADPWFDRHPVVAIACVAFVAISLISAVVYGVVQFVEYLRYALEAVRV